MTEPTTSTPKPISKAAQKRIDDARREAARVASQERIADLERRTTSLRQEVMAAMLASDAWANITALHQLVQEATAANRPAAASMWRLVQRVRKERDSVTSAARKLAAKMTSLVENLAQGGSLNSLGEARWTAGDVDAAVCRLSMLEEMLREAIDRAAQELRNADLAANGRDIDEAW